jgi:peptidoglycan/LPS O-acetylase OafA/YrhL
MPALDGLRAFAVALVMAYHGGIAGLSTAGYYGVDIFFVLSGFLITTLLLDEQASNGRVRFLRFWGRRARRLLPGLLVMLVVVDVYVAHFAPKGRYPTFRSDALSALFYVSNWHFVLGSSNYFASTGAPSLLTHTWSLAIEEQFYLLWPLLVWAVVRLARRTRTRPAILVVAVGSAGALASAGWMASLYRSGTDLSRLYYGTDTHAQSILVGTALAGALALWRPSPRPSRSAGIALLAMAGLVWAACTLGSANPITYQGGFLAVSLLSAVLVAVLVLAPDARAGRLLALPPLAYLGRISYGMYLWYFPVFEVLDRSRTGLNGGALFAARCAADVAVAALSFHAIELPIRSWRPRASARPLVKLLPAGLGAGAVAAAALLVVADVPAASIPTSPSVSAGFVTGGGADASHPGAVRILLVGDSTGLTLGADLAFPSVESEYGYVMDDQALLGCGVTLSYQLQADNQPVNPPAACSLSAPPSEQWPALLRHDINTFHPDVVLVAAGRWEVRSRRTSPAGPWLDVTQPQDASYVEEELDLAASIALDGNARVALATAPCYSSGEQPNGDPWPEDSSARLSAYNSIVRAVVARHHGPAVAVDLNAMVCPAGKFHTTLNGSIVRSPDGVHYPFFSPANPYSPDPDTIGQAEAFGQWIAPKVMAALLKPALAN